MNDYQWPASFWPGFLQHYWEKDPLLIDCPSRKPFIDMHELYDVVTHMPKKGRSDRFWIARNKPAVCKQDFAMAPLKALGPQTLDKDFPGFFKRMKQHLFGINIHALDKANADMDSRTATITGSIPDKRIQRWVTDTFFGNYQATPFGIHRDPASVFSFCLSGRRTYYTWKMDYFQPDDPALQTPDYRVIEEHIKDAERFDMEPGKLFYWPSNRWHVVVSDQKPFVVVQLSAYFNPADVDQT